MNQGRELLKLRAEDAEDLQVIAGMLQDAIVPAGDMRFDPANQEFVLVANRFCWEAGAGRRPPAERVNCGVTFSNVTRVERRGLDGAGQDGFLSLLTVSVAPDSATPQSVVILTFSGEAAIRLETGGLLCHLEDFGEPWPTQWRPQHGD